MEDFDFETWHGAEPAWGRLLGDLAPAQDWPMQADFAWGRIAEGAGRGLRRFVLRRDGAPIAAAQIVGRWGLWLASRGVVVAPGLPAETEVALLRGLARRVPGGLVTTPDRPLAGRGLLPLVTARHHALWSLAPEPEALRAGLEQKWRNRLAQAERAGLVIERREDPGVVLAREAAQQKARGYRALPPDFVRAWEIARPGAILCLTARAGQGSIVAGVVFLRHGAAASYHAGWTSEEGRRLGAHNLLLWQAALRLWQAGARVLDLGDIDSQAGAGRMRFKLGTGAVARSLGATMLVLPQLTR